MNYTEAQMTCYICPSEKHVHNHHYDCCRGKKSLDTVPLCRRCHYTYHTLGVNFFDDEYLDKAIEIENRRREICGEPPMTRQDVKRSGYFNEKHGLITNPREKLEKEAKVLGYRKVPPSKDMSKCPECGAHGYYLILPWVSADGFDPEMRQVKCLQCAGISYVAPAPFAKKRAILKEAT